jgi:hypothetical protein
MSGFDGLFAIGKTITVINNIIMKAASINEIKKALKEYSSEQLLDICLRLARYKKENKELLTYLLFEAADPDAFIKSGREEIEAAFAAMNTTNLFAVKKSLRKLLRTINKYIRFAASKTVEVELLIHFCLTLNQSKIPVRKSAALTNMYGAQLKKIRTVIATFHEDLQYDYRVQLEQL